MNEKEFAFSVDNVRPSGVVSWFSIADDEPSSLRLAHVVGLIRSDAQYRSAFDARFDELLSLNGLMARDTNGDLVWASSDSLQKAFTVETGTAILEQLDRDGFTEGACHVLRRVGFTAWRNEAGCVAIDPGGCETATPSTHRF